MFTDRRNLKIGLALMATLIMGGVVGGVAVNATISSTPTAIVSPYSCERGADFFVYPDNAGEYYADAGSGIATVPCGTLEFGGPTNAGGITGTNATGVIRAAILAAHAQGNATVDLESGQYVLTHELNVYGANLVGVGGSLKFPFPLLNYTGPAGGIAVFANNGALPITACTDDDYYNYMQNIQVEYAYSLLTATSRAFQINCPSSIAPDTIFAFVHPASGDAVVNDSIGIDLNGAANGGPVTLNGYSDGEFGNGTYVGANHVTLLNNWEAFSGCGISVGPDSVNSAAGPPYNTLIEGGHEYHDTKYAICVLSNNGITIQGGFDEGATGVTLGDIHISGTHGAGMIEGRYSINTVNTFLKSRVTDLNTVSKYYWIDSQDGTQGWIIGTSGGGFANYYPVQTITAGTSVWSCTVTWSTGTLCGLGPTDTLVLASLGGITAMTCNGVTVAAALMVLGYSCFLTLGETMTVTWATTAPTFKLTEA
jgi:hypothetical protein